MFLFIKNLLIFYLDGVYNYLIFLFSYNKITQKTKNTIEKTLTNINMFMEMKNLIYIYYSIKIAISNV